MGNWTQFFAELTGEHRRQPTIAEVRKALEFWSAYLQNREAIFEKYGEDSDEGEEALDDLLDCWMMAGCLIQQELARRSLPIVEFGQSGVVLAELASCVSRSPKLSWPLCLTELTHKSFRWVHKQAAVIRRGYMIIMQLQARLDAEETAQAETVAAAVMKVDEEPLTELEVAILQQLATGEMLKRVQLIARLARPSDGKPTVAHSENPLRAAIKHLRQLGYTECSRGDAVERRLQPRGEIGSLGCGLIHGKLPP